jgi:hypothetical protein
VRVQGQLTFNISPPILRAKAWALRFILRIAALYAY